MVKVATLNHLSFSHTNSRQPLDSHIVIVGFKGLFYARSNRISRES